MHTLDFDVFCQCGSSVMGVAPLNLSACMISCYVILWPHARVYFYVHVCVHKCLYVCTYSIGTISGLRLRHGSVFEWAGHVEVAR